MHRKWTNQYIPLSHAHERILEESKGGFDSDALAAFERYKQQYNHVALEIGSGSGMHLLRQARENPETLYIGIELRYKRAFKTVEKAEKSSLSNLFIVRGNATLLSQLFTPKELSALFIHYPDPWSKKRWKKHRILQIEFLKLVATFMKEGALFSFRTDHSDYFEEVLSLIENMDEFSIETLSRHLYKESPGTFQPSSEFEALFYSKGVPLNALIARRA